MGRPAGERERSARWVTPVQGLDQACRAQARASVPVSGGWQRGGRHRGGRVRDAEKEMLRLERRRDQVRQALTATVDYVELTRLGDELHAVQAALDAAEESWLALALEAEG